MEELGPELSRKRPSKTRRQKMRSVTWTELEAELQKIEEVDEYEEAGRGGSQCTGAQLSEGAAATSTPACPSPPKPSEIPRRGRRTFGPRTCVDELEVDKCSACCMGIPLNKMETHCFAACEEARIPLNKMETLGIPPCLQRAPFRVNKMEPCLQRAPFRVNKMETLSPDQSTRGEPIVISGPSGSDTGLPPVADDGRPVVAEEIIEEHERCPPKPKPRSLRERGPTMSKRERISAAIARNCVVAVMGMTKNEVDQMQKQQVETICSVPGRGTGEVSRSRRT